MKGRTRGMAHEEERLPSKHKALPSNPSTTKVVLWLTNGRKGGSASPQSVHFSPPMVETTVVALWSRPPSPQRNQSPEVGLVLELNMTQGSVCHTKKKMTPGQEPRQRNTNLDALFIGKQFKWIKISHQKPWNPKGNSTFSRCWKKMTTQNSISSENIHQWRHNENIVKGN
jgi:hypothetical protein